MPVEWIVSPVQRMLSGKYHCAADQLDPRRRVNAMITINRLLQYCFEVG